MAGKVEVNRPYARSRCDWKDSQLGLKRIGFIWLRERASGGLCEHGNEYSVSTNLKKKNFRTTGEILFSQKGLSSVEIGR